MVIAFFWRQSKHFRFNELYWFVQCKSDRICSESCNYWFNGQCCCRTNKFTDPYIETLADFVHRWSQWNSVAYADTNVKLCNFVQRFHWSAENIWNMKWWQVADTTVTASLTNIWTHILPNCHISGHNLVVVDGTVLFMWPLTFIWSLDSIPGRLVAIFSIYLCIAQSFPLLISILGDTLLVH